jgi:copper chaperone NosL
MSAKALRLLLGILLLAGLSACSGDAGTGPKEVRWDRDACSRCRMVLNDRYHAVQIRYYPQGKDRSVVALFDDIGCASLWLSEQPWRDDPRTEIWVAERRTGEWIDARSATYVSGDDTPMQYGLGAQQEPVVGGLSFEQATQHILDVERRYNLHSVNPLDRFGEQARQREADEHAGHEAPLSIR